MMGAMTSPWPQWRSHWHVWHAWPPVAQYLLWLVLSVATTLAGSIWWSSECWQLWWDADEVWQQAEQDLQTHQQRVDQLHQRIQALREQAHPSGWPVPAWQPWPQAPLTDDTEQLQQWLSWGREHGLVAQAMPMTGAHTVRWRGSLPALLAACHGVPHAFPRLKVVAMAWQPVPDSDRLQLELSWTAAKDTLVGDTAKLKKPTVPNKPDAEGPSVASVAFHPPPAPSAHALYNPFQVSALRSGVPASVLSQPATGWPQLQHQDMAQLRWVGTLDKPGEQQALFAFHGLVYPVHVGDSLGQDWGRVTQIARDHVVLREWLTVENGQWRAVLRRWPAAGGSP